MLRSIASNISLPQHAMKRSAVLCIHRRYTTGGNPTRKRQAKTTGKSTGAPDDKGTKTGNKGAKATVKNSSKSTRQTDKRTTLEKGTAFEIKSLQLLRDNFSMSLERVAGPGDGGVDLVGWWWIPRLPGLETCTRTKSSTSGEDWPHTRSRIRVIAQCKAEKLKVGPNYVRELEGVLHRMQISRPFISETGTSSMDHEHLPSHPSRPVPTLAMLISQSPFTKGAILRAISSPLPFILLHFPLEAEDGLPDDHEQRPALSLQWNLALGSKRGLLGGHLEVRWERKGRAGRPTLWWQGRPMLSCVPE